MFDSVRFLWKWNKFGLGLRRLIMDLGDKKATQSMTWWGVALLTIDGVLALIHTNFGAVLPPPWGDVLLQLGGLVGTIMIALGIRRAVGRKP